MHGKHSKNAQMHFETIKGNLEHESKEIKKILETCWNQLAAGGRIQHGAGESIWERSIYFPTFKLLSPTSGNGGYI